MDEEAALVLEGKYDGLRDFVLQVVENFDNRLQQLEDRSDLVERVRSNENSIVSIEKRLLDVETSMEEREELEVFDEGIAVCSSPKISKVSENLQRKNTKTSVMPESRPPKPPVQLAVRTSEKYPRYISELSKSLQEDIKNFNINLAMDSKCKVTEAQNAYIVLWYNKKKRANVSITGKQSDVMMLMGDARNDKIWPTSWKPEGIKNSFREYLAERLKMLRKKDEANKEKEDLQSGCRLSFIPS